MNNHKKNKKKQKNNNEINDEDIKEESLNQNINLNQHQKKNKNNSNSNNSSAKSENKNNINNINNNKEIEQSISSNKKKKKRDKKKANRQSSNSNYISENNNNIKNISNSNFNHNINNFNIKQKEPSNQQKLEEANLNMQQMNFIKAEKQYKSILENCGNSSSQFMINLLNNYSICLLNQRKFEESANFATKIILEYDNKNKRAYLTMLIILYNIKEYKKALELIDRINIIFKKAKDIDYFKSTINDINNAVNEDEDNKLREIYYKKKKKNSRFY